MKLSNNTLSELGSAVAVPSYDRSKVTRGIVHFGVGGFHRAHQAMYVDALMNTGEGLDWGICGVGALPHDTKIVDTLNEQDGLYTMTIKHPDGRLESRVLGSIIEMLHAPSNPQAVLDAMTDPATRVVSLTITEGGYLINQATGQFDPSDASIQADLTDGATPSTAFGYIIAALAARRVAGVPPFTVMSCDNLPGNGEVAHHAVGAFARLKDPELADYIEAEVPFPNSMVDRITPVTTPEDIASLKEETGVQDGWPVVCEPFTQWVLEDKFASGRPQLENVGVQVVEDVVPFELMKLRLLNVSHQAMSYVGFLSGYTYAHEVCQDPLFVKFLSGYMANEGIPTLPVVPDTDLTAYREKLIERFANPNVRDTLKRLCAESSDRIPKWLIPVINENLASGGQITHSAMIVASWARYAEGVDEHGEPIEVVDRIKDRVMAAAAKQKEDPLAFLRAPDLFGNLVENERFTTEYTAALASLHELGARASVENLTAR
ncbi:mannitol dehydrogenase family protein [Ornithinimicrobium sp. Arc0846-15]|nr:mannitol dehydrogenase family protein [Ornithinimicrobium laminariae]